MKIYLIFFFGLFITIGFAQMPVTDAATGTQLTTLNLSTKMSNSTLASQLSTAGSQLTQLQQTYEQIKSAADKIEKVNQAITSINNIAILIKQQSVFSI